MITFDINEKKKTVIAYFKDPDGIRSNCREVFEYDLCDNLRSILHRDLNMFMPYNTHGINSSIINYSTFEDEVCQYVIDKVRNPKYKCVGIAKCHEDDEFDVNIGKKIARANLITKYNELKYQALNICKTHLMNAAYDILKISAKVINRNKVIEKDVEETLKKHFGEE